MKRSDTPRTDAAFEAVDQDCKSQFEWDGWKFARKLERELAAATLERNEWEFAARNEAKLAQVVVRELDEARAEIERLRAHADNEEAK